MKVVSVSARKGHGLGKTRQLFITLLEGKGVKGDAHCGATIKHRSRLARFADQPNPRQVHLIHAELLDELAAKGFAVAPGELGENILTQNVDLLGLSTGAVLTFPSGAAIEITGLRNPCRQLEGHSKGLMQAVLDKDAGGNLVRKCGVMGVVLNGGEVAVGDAIEATHPSIFKPLDPV